MKKLFTLIIVCLTTISTWAYDVCVDGIYYNLDKENKTAEVTYKNYFYDSIGNILNNSYEGIVIIPDSIVSNGVMYSVMSVGEEAFRACSCLTSVTIPNSVTSIGKYAFEGCSDLTSVTIPNSVTNIGEAAFKSCYGLTSVTVDVNNENYCSENNVIYTKDKTTLVYCISSMKGQFVIPNSVTIIGITAFSGCAGLTSVTIPNSVTSIGKCAFDGCTRLTSVTIPNSVTSVGIGAFSDCVGLTSVTIPNSVTKIGSCAFSGCTGLTSATIPDSVTSIGDWAFSSCIGLTSMTIPDSVTSIGIWAFNCCIGLTSVTIPNSVTSIGEYAFWYCSRLASVTCLAKEVPETGSNLFTYVPQSSATLYVPSVALEAYKSTAPWSEFGTILPIDESTALKGINYAPSNSVTYNINGQNAKEGDKGIMIRDGKKFIVK